MNSFSNISLLKCLVFSAFMLMCLLDYTEGIRCYKCKGDDECDFKTRHIYIDNCTWATKCWGARIGDHFIRSCADDRCEIQIGVGSYIESKCCYTDMCNDDTFFFPNNSNRLFSAKKSLGYVCALWMLLVMKLKLIGL